MDNLQSVRGQKILDLYSNVPQKETEIKVELQKSEIEEIKNIQFSSLGEERIELYREIIQKGTEQTKMFNLLKSEKPQIQTDDSISKDNIESISNVEQQVNTVPIRDNGEDLPVTEDQRKMALDFMKTFYANIADEAMNLESFIKLVAKAYYLDKSGNLTPDTFAKEAIIQLNIL